MPDDAGLKASDLHSLRGSALIDALERIDPAELDSGKVDLDAVVGAVDPASLGDDDFRRLLDAMGKLADRAPDLDLSSIEAGAFARLVASASASQLEAALSDARLRTRLLDEIFRRMESHVRSDRVKRMHAVVRWRLTGGSGEGDYDRYECTLADGACVVSKERSKRPRVTITVAPPDFVRIITRQATPAVLYVTGKLKVNGDLGFAAGLIGYFDLPEA